MPIIRIEKMFESLLWLATGVLSLCSVAAHGDVDTSEWKCEFCPFPSGYEANIDAGAEVVSDDALRFGNASGYDDSGVYANLGGEGHVVEDGYQLNWFAEDLGLDSRVFNVDVGPQGQFGVYLDYSELPYRLFDTTSTVFTAAGDTLTLPAGWVDSASTSGFTALAGSLRRVDIASDRQTLTAGGHFLATPDLRFFVDYRHQERDGVDVVAGANFIQSSLLPRMLDYETDLIDLGVSYAKGPLNLSLAWSGSTFRNKAAELTWDNPFTPFTGAQRGRLALEPDNDFQQFALSGSYAVSAFDTVLAFSAANGRGEQDEAFLPYTINAGITANSLPRANLGGKVDTMNYAFTLTSRPLPKARLKFSYRFDERDNRTARSSWSRVIVDGVPSGDSELNTPYSFERSRLGVSGSYRVLDNARVSAGFDRTEQERDFQEVAEQTEDSGWVRANLQATDWLDIDVKGGSSKREIDRYNTALAVDFGQNPLLRKYNMAYRYREFGELTATASPLELPFTVGLTALWADDRYDKSQLGMTASETKNWNVDFNWTVSEKTSAYVFGGKESIDAQQAGSQAFAAPDWYAMHEDVFFTFGGGVRLSQISEKTSLRLDYTRTDGETSIYLARNRPTDGRFPDLESTLDSLRLSLSYARSDKLTIDFSLLYEGLETRDWALAGVEPGTIPTVLSLGADPYDYDVWVAGLSFRYRIAESDEPR